MAIKGYWGLKTNSSDMSGNGLNGTDTSMSYNSAGVFNGSSSKIILPNLLPSSPTSYTISALIKPVNVTGEKVIICDRYGGSYSYKYRFELYDSAVCLWMYNGGTIFQANCGSVVAGNWQHVFCQFDLAAAKLRSGINGKILAEGDYIAGAYPSNTNQCSIGVVTGPVTQLYFNGQIREIKFFTNIISPAEIKNEYSRIKGTMIIL